MLSYAGYIIVVYIRLQDFVGSITVAPSQSRRIFRTTIFLTQQTWQISNCRISKQLFKRSLMGCARKVIMTTAACQICWRDCQIRLSLKGRLRLCQLRWQGSEVSYPKLRMRHSTRSASPK